MTRAASKTQYSHTCAECGADFRANVSPDGKKTFCPACFAKHLSASEREVLEDYLRFGSRARSAAAAVLEQAFAAATDVRTRKFLAAKVFEELILATEDLAMLYFALRQYPGASVLEGLLHTQLTTDRTEQWRQELASQTVDQLLEQLGFLRDGVLAYAPPGGDPSVVMRALRQAIGEMRDAASFRLGGGGATVQAVNKLKHGFLAVSIGEYAEGQVPPDQAVVVLYTDRALGRIQRGIIEATDAKVRELAQKIQGYAGVSTCLLTSYLCMTRKP
jgi:hypothetical protein